MSTQLDLLDSIMKSQNDKDIPSNSSNELPPSISYPPRTFASNILSIAAIGGLILVYYIIYQTLLAFTNSSDFDDRFVLEFIIFNSFALASFFFVPIIIQGQGNSSNDEIPDVAFGMILLWVLIANIGRSFLHSWTPYVGCPPQYLLQDVFASLWILIPLGIMSIFLWALPGAFQGIFLIGLYATVQDLMKWFKSGAPLPSASIVAGNIGGIIAMALFGGLFFVVGGFGHISLYTSFASEFSYPRSVLLLHDSAPPFDSPDELTKALAAQILEFRSTCTTSFDSTITYWSARIAFPINYIGPGAWSGAGSPPNYNSLHQPTDLSISLPDATVPLYYQCNLTQAAGANLLELPQNCPPAELNNPANNNFNDGEGWIIMGAYGLDLPRFTDLIFVERASNTTTSVDSVAIYAEPTTTLQDGLSFSIVSEETVNELEKRTEFLSFLPRRLAPLATFILMILCLPIYCILGCVPCQLMSECFKSNSKSADNDDDSEDGDAAYPDKSNTHSQPTDYDQEMKKLALKVLEADSPEESSRLAQEMADLAASHRPPKTPEPLPPAYSSSLSSQEPEPEPEPSAPIDSGRYTFNL